MKRHPFFRSKSESRISLAKPGDFSVLEIDTKTVEYEFVIKNFATNQWRLDETVNSPIFPEFGFPQWYIQVCPRGRNEKNEKFAAFLMLKSSKEGQTVSADYKMNFLNDNRLCLKPGGGQMHFAISTGFGLVIEANSSQSIPVSNSGDLIINVRISIMEKPVVIAYHDNKVEVKNLVS